MASSNGSSSLSSLPTELLSNIIARLPKRNHPVLAIVCKKFRDVVRSYQLRVLRRILGKDSLYIHITGQKTSLSGWFTLRRNESNPTEDVFTPTRFPVVNLDLMPVAIGPEILVINRSGAYIYHSVSEVLTRLPQLPQDHIGNGSAVGSVGNKFYVFVSKDFNKTVQYYDLNLRLGWQYAPDIEGRNSFMVHQVFHTKEIDKKICFLRRIGTPTSYNPEDGVCDSNIIIPREWRTGACVIDNTLFAFVSSMGGLIWFDSIALEWKVVQGLNLNQESVEMGEYYGNIAIVWLELNVVCCTFVALEKSETGFSGTAEATKQLGIVELSESKSVAKLAMCLSVLV